MLSKATWASTTWGVYLLVRVYILFRFHHGHFRRPRNPAGIAQHSGSNPNVLFGIHVLLLLWIRREPTLLAESTVTSLQNLL